MTISSSPRVSTPRCTLRTPRNSTAAVPAAVTTFTSRPNVPSVTASRMRASTPLPDRRLKRSRSPSSWPKALTTRIAPSASWITRIASVSRPFTVR